jgi:acetoacetyl-[acyl-carrier protein] synthase
VVLFDDSLALETGATVLGAAADVFVNADGYKKSISGPGVGNYLTMAALLPARRPSSARRGCATAAWCRRTARARRRTG